VKNRDNNRHTEIRKPIINDYILIASARTNFTPAKREFASLLIRFFKIFHTINSLVTGNVKKAEINSQNRNRKAQSWVAIGTLVVFAVLYSLSALLAPFWNDHDTWSNLLPIIHFRHSIIDQHTLPIFTDLWYGGREQWANPLWSFFYLPSTIVWLITPLDWGARIVFLGHFIFSLFAASKLASLFLETELENLAASIILASPMFPALTAGHIEKVMSWGWILLAIFFLLNQNLTSAQRGLGSGVCLGIIPLTGANYYTLYAGILLLPLAFSFKDRKLLLFGLLGALIGLLHVPSIWHMIGHARTHAKVYIEAYSVNLPSIISALATGLSNPLSWETWTPIGILMVYLFLLIFFSKTKQVFLKSKNAISPQEISLLISVVVLCLLATGIAYRGHPLFDSFRTPARALAFIALGTALIVLINAKGIIAAGILKPNSLKLFLLISAVQIAASAWVIRPEGSTHSPYEESVQQVADILTADHAENVWFSAKDLSYMYIHVGLTRNNLALPVVYYGDMGQVIQIKGKHCGYSFDHLLAFAPVEGSAYELNAGIEWSDTQGRIPLDNLFLVEQVLLDGDLVNIYRVVCNE